MKVESEDIYAVQVEQLKVLQEMLKLLQADEKKEEPKAEEKK